MQTRTSPEVAALLLAWSAGDRTALDRLVPLVHAELRRLVRRYMRRERIGHTLQTTALIHEAYLRLVDAQNVRWQPHALLRHLRPCNAARAGGFRPRAGYRKRGGGGLHVPLDDALLIADAPDENLVALDQALTALAEIDAHLHPRS